MSWSNIGLVNDNISIWQRPMTLMLVVLSHFIYPMSTDYETSLLHLRRSALQNGLAGSSLLEGEIVPRIKTFLSEAREIQLQAQRAGVDGGQVAKIRSDAVDIILEALYVRVGKDAEAITLVATGGYGRAELCPLSDIDLLYEDNALSNCCNSCCAVPRLQYASANSGLKDIALL